MRFSFEHRAHFDGVSNISIKRENLSFFKRNCQIKSKLLQIK